MGTGFIRERRKIQDRRSAVRLPRSGPVEISISEPAKIAVTSELIEASAVGFRISHSSKELVPGVIVDYSAADYSGRARVIWTHVLEGRYVSGLILL